MFLKTKFVYKHLIYFSSIAQETFMLRIKILKNMFLETLFMNG